LDPNNFSLLSSSQASSFQIFSDDFPAFIYHATIMHYLINALHKSLANGKQLSLHTYLHAKNWNSF
jgi:hypothetical protein